MSTGGTTWAGAVPVDIGGTNTFDISTTVAGPDQPYWAGYWTYTPATDVTLHLDTEGTTTSGAPDTYLKVFSGADPGTLVAYDDDGGTGTLSSLDTVLNAGTTYHIRAGTYDDTGDDVLVINLNATAALYVAPLVTDYPVFIDYYGPRLPVAWDGGHKHVMVSVTNNNRWYGIETTEGLPPSYLGGFGFNPTPATSNNPYQENSDFVHPGVVPMLAYVDAEATDKHQVMTLDVAASHGVTGLAELHRIAYPSQTATLSGFLRAVVVFPDDPVVRAYGNDSTTHAVECWETTIGSDGSLSAWTSLGLVTYPDPGSIPGGGAHYGESVFSPLTISNRLAIQQNTRMMYDRLNPLVFTDAYGLLASAGGYTTGDVFFTSARSAPNHLGAVQRNAGNTQYWIADALLSDDGLTVVSQQTWEAPAGLDRIFAGYTHDGKVVAYCSNFLFPANNRAFYDIFGDDIEFTSPYIAMAPGVAYNGVYVRPTLPQAGTPDVTDTYDSWLTFNDTPLTLEMWITAPAVPDPVYPCDTPVLMDLSAAQFFGTPHHGQYGDGVIYATATATDGASGSLTLAGHGSDAALGSLTLAGTGTGTVPPSLVVRDTTTLLNGWASVPLPAATVLGDLFVVTLAKSLCTVTVTDPRLTLVWDFITTGDRHTYVYIGYASDLTDLAITSSGIWSAVAVAAYVGAPTIGASDHVTSTTTGTLVLPSVASDLAVLGYAGISQVVAMGTGPTPSGGWVKDVQAKTNFAEAQVFHFNGPSPTPASSIATVGNLNNNYAVVGVS